MKNKKMDIEVGGRTLPDNLDTFGRLLETGAAAIEAYPYTSALEHIVRSYFPEDAELHVKTNLLMGAALARATLKGDRELTPEQRSNAFASALFAEGLITIFDECAERRSYFDPQIIAYTLANDLGMDLQLVERLVSMKDPENKNQTLVQRYAHDIVAEEEYKEGIEKGSVNFDEYLGVTKKSNGVSFIFASVATALDEESEIKGNWNMWQMMDEVLRIYTDLRDPGKIIKDLNGDWGNVCIIKAMCSELSLSKSIERLLGYSAKKDSGIRTEIFPRHGGCKMKGFVKSYYWSAVSLLRFMATKKISKAKWEEMQTLFYKKSPKSPQSSQEI